MFSQYCHSRQLQIHKNFTSLISMNTLVLWFLFCLLVQVYALANWSMWVVLQEVNEMAGVHDGTLNPDCSWGGTCEIWDRDTAPVTPWRRNEDTQEWLKKTTREWGDMEILEKESQMPRLYCYSCCRVCWSGADNLYMIPSACSLSRIHKVHWPITKEAVGMVW